MSAADVVAQVVDPELPMLTLVDLGIVRSVEEHDGVVVTLTPTYSGCPAVEVMRADVAEHLRAAGYERVEVRTVLSPAWSTDRITEGGRAKLAAHGIAPPGRAPHRTGPVPLTLAPPGGARCPQCGSPDTVELSRFGPTPCTALRRCRGCSEPFQEMKTL
ncbi:MAG: 1,2-phenylacetyl-CoA epoxidase subunit PaaD [Pseudonocardia sp.]